MSIDIVTIVSELGLLIAGIVMLFLIPRAIIIGRKFVSRTFKSRAFWFAGVMIIALFALLSALISLLFNLYPSSSFSGLGINAFLAWVLVMFVYADSTILVTLEMDFLHRNTFHWRPVRTLAYVAIFANVFYLYAFISVTKAPTCSGLCPPVYLPGLPSWVPAIFPGILVPEALLVFIVTFGYALSAVIVGARRTSDMTMKRHVRWLGLSFLVFLGFFVAMIISPNGNLLLASFLVLVLVYTFYGALMSLTRIGRVDKVEKEIKR